MPDLAKFDYVHRVNRAIDHALTHLAEPLPLEELAAIACFSPCHFHRVFRALMGETLHAFVKRSRLERAVQRMSYRDATLTEIALECGFSSSSDFSRSFRDHFGVPPSSFDLEHHRRQGRDAMTERIGPQLARLPDHENPDGFVVRLRPQPARRLAYLRVVRAYEGGGVLDTVERLVSWARERGLEGGPWLGYQWDDPEVVPLERCRYDVGLELPPGVEVDDRVNTIELPATTLAELDLAGDIALEMRAIDFIYRGWLPTSGYVPDDQPCFEAWHGLPFAHGTAHFELRFQLPVILA